MQIVGYIFVILLQILQNASIRQPFFLWKLMFKIWTQGCSFLLLYLKLVLFTKTYFSHILLIILDLIGHFDTKEP